MRIFVLGPCRKINRVDGGLYPSFSADSRSGRFLRNIILDAAVTDVAIEFDNIIDDSVVDASGREYIPRPDVLCLSLLNHRLWHEADAVIALGEDVRKAFALARKSHRATDRREIFIHHFAHPSYVLRRPRTERESFAKDFVKALRDCVPGKLHN